MIECMFCIYKDATVVIVLENGHEVYACEEHIAEVIEENADTDNPVHSIEKYEAV